MTPQAVMYACRHRGVVHHAGTAEDGQLLARYLARSQCRDCDPAASPVRWFHRAILDSIRAAECPPPASVALPDSMRHAEVETGH